MSAPPGGWTAEQLALVDAAVELSIAVRGADGSLRRATPIWVVRVDGQVLARTWYRRGSGWFGAALVSHRARVQVPGLTADVEVEDVSEDADLRTAVDAAYRGKYGGRGAGSMVTDAAAATTLRLVPQRPAGPSGGGRGPGGDRPGRSA